MSEKSTIVFQSEGTFNPGIILTESNYDVGHNCGDAYCPNGKNFPTSEVVMKDPEDIAAYRKSIERQWVHIFLAGLGGDFEQVRGEILHKDPLPNLEECYALIRREAVRHASMKVESDNPDTLAMTGHTKSRCFEIVGYPNWWDHNRDQRKKDSKKTSTATIAEIKTEANVDEKASALIAATDYGDKSHPLDLLHKNLFPQPMDIQTRQTIGFGIKRGKLYYLDLQSKDSNKLRQALMADGSEEEKKKMTWLCLMKTKDEVNLLFQKFHKMIETQYNAKVRVLRSDNGGEYQSSDLQKVVRAFLIAAKTPISYWGEAITSAVYLINRVPSNSINFQTPLQALTNVVVAPTVPNLPPRVFGCVAFVHLHKHQRTKLTSHALQCVFVGYALHKKGYRCYHPPTRQMYITMDVVFHEDSMYFSSESELQGEYHKEIQTLDYDYHISKEDESGQSELVN
ncbi:Retrovirus-related Pol polyprotein from transposon TNT 1-94 [Vitis vinifera]|uniref:Retrovirus-related Pol polyprotein from transposon TNT 1-94 n=1 Tax=Vitis vinifera TaxID=29760 RepID=A0A438BV14_VITVI|nr:Retrovirus-related Pol polyprotein from transposon TNT 1-94 [Vitis vinifera]